MHLLKSRHSGGSPAGNKVRHASGAVHRILIVMAEFDRVDHGCAKLSEDAPVPRVVQCPVRKQEPKRGDAHYGAVPVRSFGAHHPPRRIWRRAALGQGLDHALRARSKPAESLERGRFVRTPCSDSRLCTLGVAWRRAASTDDRLGEREQEQRVVRVVSRSARESEAT